MSKSKIGTAEAVMMILTIVIAQSVLSLPANILTTFKSASILNLIFVGFLAILFSLLIFRLFKKFPGMDIIDISELLGGKIFKNIIGIIFMIYFTLSASFMLRNFCESIKIIYYPMTNILFILALFVIAVCIANRLEFSATLKTNLIILPLALLSIVFLLVTNMNNFVPEKIFPILGNGFFDTFILGITNLSSFGGIVYLYFLPPLLKDPSKFKKIALLSIGATALYLIFCVAILLFMFSFFVNVKEISPHYNAAMYIEFGTFFQRLESIFLLIWILVMACYVSFVSKFMMNIFQKLTQIKSKKPLIDIFGILIFAVALLPKNFAISQSFESKIYPYLVFGIAFVLGIGILILANLLKKKRENASSIPYSANEKGG